MRATAPTQQLESIWLLRRRPPLLPSQLLETSGVADAEPLAGALGRAGLRLSCVVTLVDAEQGLAALEQEVAVAQVSTGGKGEAKGQVCRDCGAGSAVGCLGSLCSMWGGAAAARLLRVPPVSIVLGGHWNSQALPAAPRCIMSLTAAAAAAAAAAAGACRRCGGTQQM
jgi:hypothetical protein